MALRFRLELVNIATRIFAAELMEARICSYECTFCADCAENKLHNAARTAAVVLCHARSVPQSNGGPASAEKHHYRTSACIRNTVENLAAHSARLRDIPPEER